MGTITIRKAAKPSPARQSQRCAAPDPNSAAFGSPGPAPGPAPMLALLAALALAACGNEPAAAPTTADTGSDTSADSGAADAAASDAGADAGQADAAPEDTATPPVDAGMQAAPYTPDRPCNSGGGPLPEGGDWLTYDDGEAASHVLAQKEWKILEVPVHSADLYEAVRFDIHGPVKVWGVQVRYGAVEATANQAVEVGIYRDFGHNGFDFWAPDPITVVSRCGDEVGTEDWVDFRLPKPIVLDQPGLLYVAQRRKSPTAPAWAFDKSLPEGCKDPNKCCDPFDACHSAWNFPTLKTWTSGNQTNYNWNGLTTTRPIDYLVRLYVEPLAKDDVATHRFARETTQEFGHRLAVGDYDGDGLDDVFDSSSKLFRNTGGKLVDVTEASGIAKLSLGANGGVFGDYDNDGDLDLMTFWETPSGGNTLLRNDGGTFVDATEKAGISDLQSYNPCADGEGKGTTHEPAAAVSWVDLDADGLLDLYIANFNCWAHYSYYVDRIWHNKGDGTFEEWTGKNGFLGVNDAKLPSRGVTAADYDADGNVDLFVHTYVLARDLLYRNLGVGKVQEIGAKAGVSGIGTWNSGVQRFGHGIGSMWGDLNNDGLLDLVVVNLAHPRFWDFSNKSEVFIQQPDHTFVDLQSDWSIPVGGAGLTFQETHSVPLLADFDLDGVLDLMITATYDGRPSEYYEGVGDGTFRLARWGSGVNDRNGWGLVAIDIDSDGDLDVLGKHGLYRNRSAGSVPAPGEAKRSFLRLRVIGDGGANRAGIGATVRVKAGGKAMQRVVDGGSGQGCQSGGWLHFGLGAFSGPIESVEITWPGGKKTSFDGKTKAIDANGSYWLTQTGKVHAGQTPPKP